MEDSKNRILEMAKRSAAAHQIMLGYSSRKKRDILYAMADALENMREEILAANAKDVADARARGRSEGFLDRLSINGQRFGNIVRAFRVIGDSKDPIGEQISRWIRPNGLEIVRRRVPIGVVGVVLESRPNVVAIAAATCFKVNNAVVIVADDESPLTVEMLTGAIRSGGASCGMPPDALQVLCSDDNLIDGRFLTSLDGLVDVAILRGNPSFVSDLVEHAKIPVLKHRGGVCHVYVDCDRLKPSAAEPAAPALAAAKPSQETPAPEAGALPPGDAAVNPVDLGTAVEIVLNSRYIEPYSCTAASVALVHRNIAPRFLPALAQKAAELDVELHGDERVAEIMPGIKPAEADEWRNPRKEITISVGVVDSLKDAIAHINVHGAHLCDSIVSADTGAQNVFMRDVDSAAVYSNASTNFTDGGEFGMGAEVGLSTDKLYARGPIGLEDLTSTKYIVRGSGQVRS